LEREEDERRRETEKSQELVRWKAELEEAERRRKAGKV